MDKGQGGNEDSQRFGNAGGSLPEAVRQKEGTTGSHHDRGAREQLFYKLNTLLLPPPLPPQYP